MERSDVSTAFEIVLEEIEAVVEGLSQDGAEAFQKADYGTARGVAETATRLEEFRRRVRALQQEWKNLFSTTVTTKRWRRKHLPRLHRGLRTPEDAFRRPLLEALVELAGSAAVNQVLDRVGEKMRHMLNDYDRQPLPSNPNTVRWRNNAQWCRYTLVREGLMKPDSPDGIWEVSEKGIAALAEERPNE